MKYIFVSPLRKHQKTIFNDIARLSLDNQLLNSITGGNIYNVTQLLLQGASPNCIRKKDNATPLHIAATKGYFKIVKKLIEFGANSVNLIDKNGFTPLHIASQNNFPLTIQELMKIKQIDLNLTTVPSDNFPQKSTALSIAILEGKIAAAKELITHGSNIFHASVKFFCPFYLSGNENDNILVASISSYKLYWHHEANACKKIQELTQAMNNKLELLHHLCKFILEDSSNIIADIVACNDAPRVSKSNLDTLETKIAQVIEYKNLIISYYESAHPTSNINDSKNIITQAINELEKNMTELPKFVLIDNCSDNKFKSYYVIPPYDIPSMLYYIKALEEMKFVENEENSSHLLENNDSYYFF